MAEDADVVLFLRARAQSRTAAAEYIEIVVAKQRNGPLGTALLKFERAFLGLPTWLLLVALTKLAADEGPAER